MYFRTPTTTIKTSKFNLHTKSYFFSLPLVIRNNSPSKHQLHEIAKLNGKIFITGREKKFLATEKEFPQK